MNREDGEKKMIIRFCPLMQCCGGMMVDWTEKQPELYNSSMATRSSASPLPQTLLMPAATLEVDCEASQEQDKQYFFHAALLRTLHLVKGRLPYFTLQVPVSLRYWKCKCILRFVYLMLMISVSYVLTNSTALLTLPPFLLVKKSRWLEWVFVLILLMKLSVCDWEGYSKKVAYKAFTEVSALLRAIYRI